MQINNVIRIQEYGQFIQYFSFDENETYIFFGWTFIGNELTWWNGMGTNTMKMAHFIQSTFCQCIHMHCGQNGARTTCWEFYLKNMSPDNAIPFISNWKATVASVFMVSLTDSVHTSKVDARWYGEYFKPDAKKKLHHFYLRYNAYIHWEVKKKNV